MVTGRDLPHTYWINLDRSPERRARMQTALDARGFMHTRIAAVDGADPSSVARVLRDRNQDAKVSACLASHLVAIRTAHANGAETALFLEDDASFELMDRWPFDLHAVFAALPPRWSALWLGYGDTPARLDALFRLRGLGVPLPGRTLWSTVAYVLHARAMAALLRRYDRGDHFDVRDFPDAHEADTVLLRTLADHDAVDPPWVLRVPLFTYTGIDSEIHAEDLPRQARARAFVLRAFPALCEGRYTPQFTWRARLRRLVAPDH